MKVTQEQKEFIAKYFTFSFTAISLDWIKRGMTGPPEELVEQVNIICKGDFKKTLKKFETNNLKI